MSAQGERKGITTRGEYNMELLIGEADVSLVESYKIIHDPNTRGHDYAEVVLHIPLDNYKLSLSADCFDVPVSLEVERKATLV
jgi:hypothetical protein